MVGEAQAAMAEFARRHDIAAVVAGGGVQMLGSSGAGTTLAGIHLGLPRYNRNIVDGSTLLFDGISAVSERLPAAGFPQRAAHPCLGPQRAQLVVSRCGIL